MPDIFVSPPTPPKAKPPTPPKAGLNPFSSFMFMPEGMRFETQQPGETIVLLLRRHFITNFGWLFTGIILIILPLTIFPFLILNDFFPPIEGVVINFIVLGWYLLTFSYLLVNFLLWYFTVSIVTDERIVDIDFVNILHKKYAETRISKVEDVTQRTGGFIQSLFNYGNVIVQTAGTEAVFIFDKVPRPGKVVKIINEIMEQIEES